MATIGEPFTICDGITGEQFAATSPFTGPYPCYRLTTDARQPCGVAFYNARFAGWQLDMRDVTRSGIISPHRYDSLIMAARAALVETLKATAARL